MQDTDTKTIWHIYSMWYRYKTKLKKKSEFIPWVSESHTLHSNGITRKVKETNMKHFENGSSIVDLKLTYGIKVAQKILVQMQIYKRQQPSGPTFSPMAGCSKWCVECSVRCSQSLTLWRYTIKIALCNGGVQTSFQWGIYILKCNDVLGFLKAEKVKSKLKCWNVSWHLNHYWEQHMGISYTVFHSGIICFKFIDFIFTSLHLQHTLNFNEHGSTTN